MSPTKRERVRGSSDGAIIEVHCFDDRPSLTESSFRPLCLNVAAIHSMEPFSATYCPGVKACLYLRKGSGGRSDDRLELREDYATVKQLIRAAQKEGLAEVQS
jgi:hypothetical protein